MMIFRPIFLAILIISVKGKDNNLGASSILANEEHGHRKLSYEKIAGYSPTTQVTDQNAIDLDQMAIEWNLNRMTIDSFDQAKVIYEQGGHSKSYAKLYLASPIGIRYPTGTRFTGTDSSGNVVIATAYKEIEPGSNEMLLRYSVSDSQEMYVNCQVGGLANSGLENLDGCFLTNGVVQSEDGNIHEYTYNLYEDNLNGRTIQYFSTEVRRKMIECNYCPYVDALYFYQYYGAADFGDSWIQAAFAGTGTNFNGERGNADFSSYSLIGRTEGVKNGTVLLNTFLWVIRHFEDALDNCNEGTTNYDPLHSWDEGVAFYTGSLEGEDGFGFGKLLHQHADKRCTNFGTCSEGSYGTSKVNMDLLDLFHVGQSQIMVGKCAEARVTKRKIADTMYIPLIQGALRYAFMVDVFDGGEKEKSQGATYAAAILPKIWNYNTEAATVIYDNMRVGATSTDFAAVKAAFEKVYGDINIKCADIGGLLSGDGDNYYEGAEPCQDGNEPKCVDSPLKMVIGRRKQRAGCDYVKKKTKKRCKFEKIATHCPLSCDSQVESCSKYKCKDSKSRFVTAKKNEGKKGKYCSYVRENPGICSRKDVAKTCRESCQYCQA